MSRRVSATVDLAAIRHNLAQVHTMAPGCKVMAAMKADAYGHGAAAVAAALDGQVDAFAVAALEEAVGLTDAGVESPVVLLEGCLDARELPDIAARGDVCVIHHDWQLAAIREARLSCPIPIWIKLDTGMNRLGFAPGRAAELAQWAEGEDKVTLIGWMTHLARADDRGDPETQRQIDTFLSAVNGLPGERSIANSGGLCGWPDTRIGWVRPGLMLYGASSLAGTAAADLNLQPAMCVASRLISIRTVQPGDAVGYGGTWRGDTPTRIGIVAVGYGDGYPRHAPSGTPVLVRGQIARTVGRVSMDMIAIDLGGTGAEIGDAVTLWSAELPVEQIAACADTIAYELLCGLTRRVRYRHANAAAE